MRVGLLGPLQLLTAGQQVPVGGRRLRTLLARLALDAGHPVTVNALSGAVWPEAPPLGQLHALHSLVSRLRGRLPADVPLRSVPSGYCLELAPDAVDALRFAELARRGRRLLHEGSPDRAAQELRAALALWRGEALADLPHSGFAAGAVARLEELRLTTLEDCAEADLAGPAELTGLIAELEAVTAAHPHRERPRGLLMRALQADGRTAEALRAYEQFRAWLVERLGTDPSEELRRVHLSLLRDGGPAAPTPPTLPTTPTPPTNGHPGPAAQRDPRAPSATGTPRGPDGTVRSALSSFVGRAAELASLQAHLATFRLVTLVGTGGAGKTRLAMTLASQRAAAAEGGGIRQVELAPVTSGEEVPRAVLATLGARGAQLSEDAAAEDPFSRLVEAFSGRDTLLVLDNCEHLVDSVARLVEDLLGRCPGLRVLATSREPLGIPGESLLPVDPMEVPGPGSTAGEVAGCDAVRLFTDRAAAVRPGFAVTPENADAVVDICRRLDGLPLAVELAAARLRLLSVEQLAARLSDRFALLTGGARTALPRHRTLRAVVAWSWDLLDEEARTLAESLAAFPSTLTLEAAERVAAPGARTLETVAALVDKSLLQPVEGPEIRYRMLETIRAYGMERLAERGGTQRARAAHARCFLELAERAEPRLRGHGQLPWLRGLTADRENLLAAFHFAHETRDTATAVRLAAATAFFWTLTGEFAQGVTVLRTALSMPGGAPAGARWAATAGYLLNTVLSGGSTATREELDRLREALPRPMPDHPAGPLVEPLTALVAGDAEAGLAAVERTGELPGPWSRGMLLLARSFLLSNIGVMDEGCGDLRRAAREFRDAGERWGLATALTHSALALTSLGRFAEAIELLEEAREPARQLGGVDQQRVWLAVARIRAGETRAARAELLDVVAHASSARHVGMARLSLADLARHEAELEEADRQYEGALELFGPRAGNAAHHSLYWIGVGRLAVVREEAGRARRCLETALQGALEGPDMMLAAEVAVGVAQLLRLRGEAAEAARVLGAAHALRGARDASNPDVARPAEALSAQLGDAAYASAYSSGLRLATAEAVELIASRVAGAE